MDRNDELIDFALADYERLDDIDAQLEACEQPREFSVPEAVGLTEEIEAPDLADDDHSWVLAPPDETLPRRPWDDPRYRQLEEDLYKAFLKARKGKTRTLDEASFEEFLPENMKRLTEDIYYDLYQPTAGIAFVNKSTNGVAREIYAAPFRDRIVHHYVFSYVADWWDRHFIYDSASCRKGKGTLFAIERMEKKLRKVSRNFSRDVIVYKGDLQGFFMSLPREKVLERALWGLDRQFAGHKTPQYYFIKQLWTKILLQDPTETVRYRGRPSDWKILPKTKILSMQPPGLGIVIGNLTSQLASNLYLDMLDQYIEKRLPYVEYGRYVDDFYMIFPAEMLPQFKRDLETITGFIQRVLQLKVHPRKSKYFTKIEQGIPFLGVVVRPRRIIPNAKFRQNYFLTSRRCLDGRCSAESVRAYEGIAIHHNGQKIVDEVYDYFHFDKNLQFARRPDWQRKYRYKRGLKKAR